MSTPASQLQLNPLQKVMAQQPPPQTPAAPAQRMFGNIPLPAPKAAAQPAAQPAPQVQPQPAAVAPKAAAAPVAAAPKATSVPTQADIDSALNQNRNWQQRGAGGNYVDEWGNSQSAYQITLPGGITGTYDPSSGTHGRFFPTDQSGVPQGQVRFFEPDANDTSGSGPLHEVVQPIHQSAFLNAVGNIAHYGSEVGIAAIGGTMAAGALAGAGAEGAAGATFGEAAPGAGAAVDATGAAGATGLTAEGLNLPAAYTADASGAIPAATGGLGGGALPGATEIAPGIGGAAPAFDTAGVPPDILNPPLQGVPAPDLVPPPTIPSGASSVASGVTDYLGQHLGSTVGGIGALIAGTRKPTLPAQTKPVDTTNQNLSAYGNAIIQSGGKPSPDQLQMIDDQVAAHVRNAREAILQNAANTGMGTNSMVTQQQLNQLEGDAVTMRETLVMQQSQQNVNNALSALGIADSNSLALANMQLSQDRQAQSTALGIAETSAYLFAQEGNTVKKPGG